ncbi:hypothetical protein H311_01584, partial [Anncaliia algerae PRA109]
LEFQPLNLNSDLESKAEDEYNEVIRHFKKYSSRTIKNHNSNSIKNILSCGDKVLLKKDFDNNILTKKQPFDSYFEENEFEIIEVMKNNTVRIMDSQTKESYVVFNGRIKKL